MACGEQGHKPVRPALGGNFAFDDVALVTAGDDDVRTLVGGIGSFFTRQPCWRKSWRRGLELAPTVRARRVRIGKRGGMALLGHVNYRGRGNYHGRDNRKSQGQPCFDRANLKEECNIHLEEARWNRYSKARRCGSEWSGIQMRRLTRSTFPEPRGR